ncbi:MAG TPA: flagellar biosynthetic protein FliO [Methylophilaceae bacterium]|nr:flagellar biosynthetic protein FliO [Methylophilaceae bacterium]
MKIHLNVLATSLLSAPSIVWAADTVAVSPTGSVLKMVLGLAVVLAVMALITWVLKRMMPGTTGQQSVVRVIGGVSVGSRERVVVVQVADRWIVVGVAPGQVNGIANLEVGGVQLAENIIDSNNPLSPNMNTFTQPFAQWLKKSAAKLTDKPN